MMLRGLTLRWALPEPINETEALADGLRVSGLTAELLARRGIESVEQGRAFINPSWNDLHDPTLLPNCERAAGRLVEAVKRDEPIVIYGDYDVDGITATAILHHIIIRAKPDAKLSRYIPHRVEEGYGLNSEAIGKIADGGAKVVVSVDCGITAIEPAEVAKQRGIDLIITDHHEMAESLPPAWTWVHPRLHEHPQYELDEQGYPFDALCGAGVAHKLAWQFARTWCGSERVSEAFRELLVHLAPLAALGTVADVVPLVGENRAIARLGLNHIKHTPLVGLNALIDSAGLRDEKIDAYAVGFRLGPRLNACGRMGHAKLACKMFTTATAAEAADIARFLNGENTKRQATERRIVTQARHMIEQRGFNNPDVRCIVLDDPHWHVGVVGIVCSRLVEAYGRPTILLSTANGDANGEASGSGRSIAGFNLHEALVACAEHLTSYGGHAMAAGLKLRREGIDGFREAIVDYAREHIAEEELTAMIELDAEATLEQLTPPVVEEMNQLAPFGQANPSPRLLVRGCTLSQPAQRIGREGKHLAIIVKQDQRMCRCISWNQGELAAKLHVGDPLDLAARPKLNHWQGRTSVELELADLRLG